MTLLGPTEELNWPVLVPTLLLPLLEFLVMGRRSLQVFHLAGDGSSCWWLYTYIGKSLEAVTAVCMFNLHNASATLGKPWPSGLPMWLGSQYLSPAGRKFLQQKSCKSSKTLFSSSSPWDWVRQGLFFSLLFYIAVALQPQLIQPS